MNWTVLKNEKDYDKALARMEEIFNAKEGSEHNAEFDLLLLLINTYEEEHYNIEDIDPIQLIKMRMEYMEIKQKDLIPFLGSKSAVSKILNYHQQLKLTDIWKLSEFLSIPVKDLAQPYGDFHILTEV